MSHELFYDPENECVTLRVKGEVSIERIHELAPKVAQMLKEKECSKLLNDMSAATIDISITDLYDSPEVMAESKINRYSKRALVVPASFVNATFLEDVTRNKGQMLKIFDSIEEAKKWLHTE